MWRRKKGGENRDHILRFGVLGGGELFTPIKEMAYCHDKGKRRLD
jgi:hypothetical protein